ncbi:MAG: fatty acid desaturase [Alphaproteobacteria bacterium]|nr:fatty acid desaturase [Alphaproteobacteria bacterium]
MAPLTAGPAAIRALSVQTDAPAALRIASQFGLIGAMAFLIQGAVSGYGALAALPLLALQGFFIAFLFMALHETAHKTAFKTRALNAVVGQICGVLIGLPYEYYRLFHWDHHRHTQDPTKDPELVVASRTDSLPHRALAFTGLLQLGARLLLMLRHAVTGQVTAPWIPEDKRGGIVLEARLYTLLYLGLAAGSVALATSLLLWVWILPVLIGQLFLRPYLYTEHTGCGRSPNAFENTRTTATNGLVRWFAWNMPYHAEHHAYPSVPFHALPALNHLVAARIVHRGQGYRRAVPAAWRALSGPSEETPPASAHSRRTTA